MIDLTPAWSDVDAVKQFLRHTPVAAYALHGTAAPGAAFAVRQRGQKRFGSSSTEISPPAGNYRLQIHDSLRSEGTANPTALVVDVFDDGVEVASFSVERASANPAEWVRLAAPFLYVEADLALAGPVEFRNGAASTQQAALVARLWPLPESYPRPSPTATYSRACGHVRAGRVYNPWGQEDRVEDEAGNVHIRPVCWFNVARVPYGFRSAPVQDVAGEYQVQVTGELTNLSSSPATLVLDFYDGPAEGGALVHTESVAAAGSATVAVSIDETLALSCGHVEIRNGRADDMQRANLLLKRWWVG